MDNGDLSQPKARRELITSAEICAQRIVDHLGKDIRLALPLGLGKAYHLTNALYQLAKRDSSVKLKIFTALTLLRPRLNKGLEKQFGNPIVTRLFGDSPDLDYATDRAAGILPANIEIEEFFLATGTLLNNEYAQRHYSSVNYTHALRRIISEEVNVLGQMVSKRGDRISLSCNPDLTLDLLPEMRRRLGRRKFLAVGEVNDELPFMPNDADIPAEEFDLLLDAGRYTLPGLPNPKVDVTSYAIGFRAAALVKDGGTLQIGIGSLGDGAAQTIRLRHTDPATFQKVLSELPGPPGPMNEGGNSRFSEGLYGCTEMFTEGMFELLRAGIFSRHASPARKFVIDGGFFLGPPAFYKRLKDCSKEQLSLVNMTSVRSVNALYGDETARRQERRDARFINIAMKVTCLGAVTSDALEDGRVVGGVGGQYNFVAQAHELEGARSIILLKAVRENHGVPESNIVWSYGNTTVPRHLRDIIITEYGVADLRGQTDEECVCRMLAITDSRFIDGLVEEAISAKKLPCNFVVPNEWRLNTPERIGECLSHHTSNLPDYPFGSELTYLEQEIAPALERLKTKTGGNFSAAIFALISFLHRNHEAESNFAPHLERLGLERADSWRQKILRSLVLYSLALNQK